MGDGTVGSGLSTSLCRIASDPAQVNSLYELLGSYCHQCRNTLNSLKLSLYLARRLDTPGTSDTWNALETRYHFVEQLFDRLQTICRPMSLSPVRMPLSLLIEEHRPRWEGQLSDRGRRLEVVPPRIPVVGDYDPYRLGQGLDALVALRAKMGDQDRPLRLLWKAEGGQFHVEWYDSDASGHEGPSGRCEPDPLALPLLARIMSAHGGVLDLSNDQGVHVSLRWPIDCRTDPS